MKQTSLTALLLLTWAPIALADTAVQFTTYPEDDVHPAWSPDGTQIAFAHGGTSNEDIWVQPVEGGAATVIVDETGGQTQPAWSPDGTQIAYAYALTIWTVPVSGGAPTEITTATTGMQGDHRPAWSPDGTKIAFHTRVTNDGALDIYTVLAGGGSMTRITTSGGYHESPSWSPEGTHIAFSWSFGSVYPYQVEVATGNESPLATGITNCVTPAWAPTGDRIAYSNGNDIFVVDIGGSAPLQLTDDPWIDTYPSWSPDGTQIAFHSNRSGNYDIWIIQVPPLPVMETSWGAIKALHRE
jgi:TolB protein